MDNNSNQIEEIKERLDIVQIIEKYVSLKQSGKNYSGLCPFHHEKTPSFIVSPDIQRYKCFGCGESGDIFNFVQKIENLDFPETLAKLAKEAGVELVQHQKNTKYSRLEDLNYLATKYYYSELKKNTIASNYITGRGFSAESIKQFGIGYAPKYPKLLEYIRKSSVKYSEDELINSGLFVKKNGTLKEKFYDRIMFPIRSVKGKVIGFSGRILPGNDYGPKYMNTGDTVIFHKKFNLFGQYESRQEIRKLDQAVLCEGQTDTIAAHQHGVKNIVAPLGTGLTKEQLESLSHLTKNIVFFFDSDSAGQNAVIRAFKLASEINLYSYATNSAPYKDIDEMVQENPDHLKYLIENKQEAFSYILTNYIKDKDLTKMSDLTETQRFLEELLSHVADPTLLKHYNEKIQSIGKFELKTSVNKGNNSASTNPDKKAFLVKSPNDLLEKTYLQLLIFNSNHTDDLYIPSRYLSSPMLRDIYLEIKHTDAKTLPDLVQIFSDDVNKKTFMEDIIFGATEMEEDTTPQLKKLIPRLKKNYLLRQQKALSVKIAIAEESNDSQQIEKLLQKVLKITKLLKEIPND